MELEENEIEGKNLFMADLGTLWTLGTLESYQDIGSCFKAMWLPVKH